MSLHNTQNSSQSISKRSKWFILRKYRTLESSNLQEDSTFSTIVLTLKIFLLAKTQKHTSRLQKISESAKSSLETPKFVYFAKNNIKQMGQTVGESFRC